MTTAVEDGERPRQRWLARASLLFVAAAALLVIGFAHDLRGVLVLALGVVVTVASAYLLLAHRGPLGEVVVAAALVGLAAVAVTSALVNATLKPAARRRRPSTEQSVRTRLVRMPRSPSYPSGHAASASEFSTAVGGAVPHVDTALRLAATVVAYSRVHTGVHYPGDVLAGALVGAGVGSAARHLGQRTGFLPGSPTGRGAAG